MEYQYAAFLLAIILLTLSPGVDTLLVLRNTARGGWRDGALTTLGISSGLFVHATVSALGVSVILLQSAWAFTLLKLAGALYLIWLGLQTLRQALRQPDPPGTVLSLPPRQPLRPWRALREGVLSNVLNPKAVVFYMAFLPQFIDPAHSALLQSALMALVHFIISMLWLVGVAVVADQARRRLKRPQLGRLFNGLNGLLLMLIGGALARSH